MKDYPQVGYAPLKKAIAEYEGVASESVICGNGAAELANKRTQLSNVD